MRAKKKLLMVCGTILLTATSLHQAAADQYGMRYSENHMQQDQEQNQEAAEPESEGQAVEGEDRLNEDPPATEYFQDGNIYIPPVYYEEEQQNIQEEEELPPAEGADENSDEPSGPDEPGSDVLDGNEGSVLQ